MNDDLVKRLRKFAEFGVRENSMVATAMTQSADRIEELEDQLKAAVEALRDIAGMDLIGASATAYNALRSIKRETK